MLLLDRGGGPLLSLSSSLESLESTERDLEREREGDLACRRLGGVLDLDRDDPEEDEEEEESDDSEEEESESDDTS